MLMFEYKYNELEQAEKIIKEGFSNRHLNGELKILAKYYKYIGKKPKEREELLYTFCKEHIEGFSKVAYFKRLNSALNHAKKRDANLIIVESIPIYKEELDYIDSLNVSHDYKKIIFTLLSLNKLNVEVQKLKGKEFNGEYYFGGTQRNYKELRLASKIPEASKRNKIKGTHEIIGDLSKDSIIEIAGKGYIKLSFMYNLPKDNLGFLINTFDNIGYYYDYHCGENKVKKCDECGELFKAASNRSKYCKNCHDGKKLESKRNWWHKNKKLEL